MREPNFNVSMLAKGKARVEIYDAIGPSWMGMIDTKLVAKQLKDAGELQEIEVRINSPGGSAYDGLGIHNLLKDHPAKVNVVIDGVAASAASIIAMAGDTVRIPANAMFMVHEPSTIAYGMKADFEKVINQLDAMIAAGTATYMAKTKQSAETVKKWMSDETWFTGQEAVDAGLADTTEKELPTAKVEPKASVQQMFSRAPSNFASLLSLSMRLPPEKPTMADTTVTPSAEPTPVVVAPVAPASPQLSAADIQNAASAAVAAERSRISNINAICQKAGKPELATQYIDSGAEVGVVQSAMFDILCQSRPPVGDAGGADVQQNATDPDAKLKAEYAAKRNLLQKHGVTEEQFIASEKEIGDRLR